MSKETEISQIVPREEKVPLSYPSLQQMPQPMPQPMPQVISQTARVPPSPMLQAIQAPLGPEPCIVTCPSCRATVLSNVQTEPGMQTHLMALLLCLICICCTCIPYLVDSCQNVVHRCGNCSAYLGTYKR